MVASLLFVPSSSSHIAGYRPQFLGRSSDHIVSCQWSPDPLQLELTHGFDLHRVLDLRQHPRTDQDLPRLRFIAEPRRNIRYGPDGGVVEPALEADSPKRSKAMRYTTRGHHSRDGKLGTGLCANLDLWQKARVMAETRKLAAILAADVVGYSRLAGSDEDRTLARLRALRSDLIDPTIAVHNGRVVKRTGDGSLVEFRSVVDAVRCAIEVQNGMVERNAGLPPERRIEFRVGIHLGDVVEESDGDLMGDGVNIAARLEGIAKPGAICLSEDAYRQVKARLDLAVSDLGPTKLKNIAEPVRVYSLEVGVPAPVKHAPQAEPATPEPSARLALPDKPSIAVLAFQNMSGDPEQEYFADGMVEEIITGLSRIKWLFVIARNSSFVYKGKAVDVRQVGRELGVRYVLEGAVRKAGNRVRITAQLLEAETGAHLWADRYDGNAGGRFRPAGSDHRKSGRRRRAEPAAVGD